MPWERILSQSQALVESEYGRRFDELLIYLRQQLVESLNGRAGSAAAWPPDLNSGFHIKRGRLWRRSGSWTIRAAAGRKIARFVFNHV